MDLKNKVEEFLRCKEDFEYFAKNYIVLELPGQNQIIKPYDKQLQLVKFIQDKKHVIVLKSRQIGISTITQSFIAWLCTFHRNVVVGIISKDGPEATSFARKIVSMLMELPKWMSVSFVKKSEQSFILRNGCQCYATPVTKVPSKTLRGKSITFLVMDECAFTENIDEAWTAIVPALATNQKMARENNIPYGTIILSTPNKVTGVGKFFYEKYKNAVAGNSILKYFEIHWKQIPQLANDPQWYKDQCALLDYNKNKIDQELELKFVTTDSTFLPQETCSMIQEITRDSSPIKKQKIKGGDIWIFEKFDSKKYYIIGVDTATNFGSDFSTIEIFDYVSLDQVWEYQGKCEVTDFLGVIHYACACYPNSCLVVENNSYATQLVELLQRSNLNSIMYKQKKDKKIIAGLSNNTRTRPLMIDALYTYIIENPKIIKSKRLALELSGLVEKNNKVEADKGMHDDLSMATAMAFYVRKFDPPINIDLEFNPDKYSDFSSMIIKLNDIQIDGNTKIDDQLYSYNLSY